MELTPAEKSFISGLLSIRKLEMTTSLENANKIEDKEHKTKVVKSLRNDLNLIEELQNKMSPFNA